VTDTSGPKDQKTAGKTSARPIDNRVVGLLACLAVLIVGWGAGWASFPLGIPGQWTWNRKPPTDSLSLALIPVLIAAGLYLGFVSLGTRSLNKCRRPALAAWLCGLVGAAFAWLWVAQESAPEPYQLSKSAWVLYYRGSSGYFSEARDQAADLSHYLDRYEEKMAEGDVLHIGTHPPGLVVIIRGLLGLCRASPALVELVTATEPTTVQAAFDELKTHERLSPSDRAVLWLAGLLVQLTAALTVIPLYGLLRLTCSRRASWQAVAFWPAIPALPVFLPKSDCLFPCLAMLFLWLWLTGLGQGSRWRLFLAGLAISFGLTLSLVFLPVGFLAVLAGFWQVKYGLPLRSGTAQPASAHKSPLPTPCRLTVREPCWKLLRAGTIAAVGFFLPIVAAWLVGRINLLNVWRLNFHNHAGFYKQFPRSYWKWLLVNPVEFAVAVGLPLALIAAWSVVSNVRRQPLGRYAHLWAGLATISVLWISGKNMGEAARLWIFLTPCVVWAIGPLFELADTSEGSNISMTLPTSTWVLVLVGQLVATALVVTQVVGFHVPEPV
jgi:hypothetical protein